MEEKKYQGIDAPVFESYTEESIDPDDRTSILNDEERYSPEGILKRALALEEAAGKMQVAEYQARFYNQARKMLRPLYPDWKPCKKDYRRIRKKMFESRARCRIELYDKGCELRDAAVTADEYRYAATVFERLKELEERRTFTERQVGEELYAEAETRGDFSEQADFCRKQADRIERRRGNRRLAVLILAAVLVIGGYLLSRTAPALKLKGDAESYLGLYDKAWQAYDVSRKKSGDEAVYEMYKEARYQAAEGLVSTGHEDKAKGYYRALASVGYRDSAEKLARLEQKYLAGKDVGKEVSFAGTQWLVLDKEQDRILLIRRDSYRELTAQPDGGPVTWANSWIREYLNTEWIQEAFYPEESALILETRIVTLPNVVSGRSGGPDVTDKVFLLSAEEARKYSDSLRETKFGWWLRSPGAEETALAFMDSHKEVMPYGYEASSDMIAVKPVVWLEIRPEDIPETEAQGE